MKKLTIIVLTLIICGFINLSASASPSVLLPEPPLNFNEVDTVLMGSTRPPEGQFYRSISDEQMSEVFRGLGLHFAGNAYYLADGSFWGMLVRQYAGPPTTAEVPLRQDDGSLTASAVTVSRPTGLTIQAGATPYHVSAYIYDGEPTVSYVNGVPVTAYILSDRFSDEAGLRALRADFVLDGILYSVNLSYSEADLGKALVTQMVNSIIGMGGLDLTALHIEAEDAEPITTPQGNTPSAWALEQVSAAIARGLVPDHLRSNYTQAITRAEFCVLAVKAYEAVKGEITGRTAFVDTNDVNVEKAAYVGIVSGVGDNRFDPDSQLTREMAAVMLSNLAEAAGRPLPLWLKGVHPSVFIADYNDISSWANQGVTQVFQAGIMTGVGDDRFAPHQPYTREQSFITVMRTYNMITSVMGGREWDVQYIRTFTNMDGIGSPSVTVISSRDELNEALRADGLAQAIERYTDSFFEDRYLALVLIQENSGSIRHRVESVDISGYILISRMIPEIGTHDMAQWHIIIEIDAEFRPEEFNVILVDKPAS